MERKAGTAVKPGETELARQLEYIRAIRAENDAFAAENGRKKKFYSLAMGCQMNAHDSEKLEGMLDEMGFDRTDEETEADFIIYNTCCVRENAEQKVYGKLGWLKHYKETKNPDAVIALCGCMMQQETVLQTLRQKYRHVDIVFGTFNLYKLPELVATRMESGETVYDIWQEQREVVEDLPAIRHFPYKASVNIMFGCNNFCSYCIVPYVRGRERSRTPEDILAEVRRLAADGVKEVMLLGQNVNSYGKNLETPVSFAELLRMVNEVEGIERIRFMTSHPKDLSDELIQAMADCDKVCKYLHLPVHEPPLYKGILHGAGAQGKSGNAGYHPEHGYHRGLPRGNGGGFPRNLGCHPQIPLQHRVYLYLFQADRHPCGNHGKSGAGGCH